MAGQQPAVARLATGSPPLVRTLTLSGDLRAAASSRASRCFRSSRRLRRSRRPASEPPPLLLLLLLLRLRLCRFSGDLLRSRSSLGRGLGGLRSGPCRG
jgi:hypothetical protein